VVCVVKEGDAVDEGQPILELHVDDAERVRSAVEALDGAIDIGAEPPERKSLVLDVIRS
jgi:thymidine phosphorylase